MGWQQQSDGCWSRRIQEGPLRISLDVWPIDEASNEWVFGINGSNAVLPMLVKPVDEAMRLADSELGRLLKRAHSQLDRAPGTGGTG
jgi:hypothetical protein